MLVHLVAKAFEFFEVFQQAGFDGHGAVLLVG